MECCTPCIAAQQSQRCGRCSSPQRGSSPAVRMQNTHVIDQLRMPYGDSLPATVSSQYGTRRAGGVEWMDALVLGASAGSRLISCAQRHCAGWPRVSESTCGLPRCICHVVLEPSSIFLHSFMRLGACSGSRPACHFPLRNPQLSEPSSVCS